MNTLEDFLKRDASLYPDKIAIFCQGNRLTYAQLYGLVCSRSSEFLPFKGKAVVFPNTQDADFIITYLAIHMAGAVAVPLEKDCRYSPVNNRSKYRSPSGFSAHRVRSLL